MDQGGSDPFTSSREGIVDDDENFKALLVFLKGEVLPKILDELERYCAAYEALDEAFDNVPGYMGDENYGNELSLVLSTARDLAKWKSISLAEFRGELDPETDGGE